MRYLSVCSGIEAATVAWHPLGWTPVAFSEIEPFPAAVLAHHYPDVPNYGDMTKHKEWPLEPGSIDLLVGGTPCQSFSVAGLRKGISDPRGGLMLTYLEIARRFRPRWVVWENVPGVLSSNGGRDFGAFLGALSELRYGWAYRVIDAQYCRVDGRWPKAVPQRRRRVFVVGCDLERDPRGRERAAEVLALGTGLRWHLAESGKTRKAAPADAEAGVGAGVPRCADTVTSKWSKGAEALQQGAQSGGNCIVTSHDVAPCSETTCHDYNRADGFTMVGQPSWPAEVAPTLNQSARGTGAPGYSDQEIFSQGAGNLVPQPVPIQDGREIQKAQNGIGIGQQGDPAYTLDTTGAQAIAQPVPYDLFQITAPVNRQNRKPGDPCHTLARDNAAHAAVAFQACGDRDNPSISVSDTAFCLPANAMSDRGQAVAFDWQKGNDVNNPRPSTMNVAVEHSQTIGTTRTPAVAFHPTQDPISSTDGSTHCMGTGESQGHSSIAVAVESLQQQGYDDGHASTQEADAVATLRVLRDEIGAEAFTAWGLGVLDSLQPSQVLRSRLHGEGIRCASFSRSWPIDCAISRPEDRAAWAVQSVREAEGEGCSPSRRELPQQLAEQLGAYLSQLPCPGPQAERLMHHLWCASEGVGILRQALSKIQEARRPIDASRPTSENTMTVRRLTATECEFLQGFPRNYTLIPWRGKPAEQCPDGPRYKALGNSMACNCMAWIGERIAAVEARND